MNEDAFIKQYFNYVDSHERVTDRRMSSNKYFIGINTALLGLIGFFFEKVDGGIAIIPLALGGIFISYLWYRIVKSYKGLNDGKFKIIHEMEEKMPYPTFTKEWDVLGKGEDKKLYAPFTSFELKIPWVFIVLYALILCGAWLSLL